MGEFEFDIFFLVSGVQQVQGGEVDGNIGPSGRGGGGRGRAEEDSRSSFPV